MSSDYAGECVADILRIIISTNTITGGKVGDVVSAQEMLLREHYIRNEVNGLLTLWQRRHDEDDGRYMRRRVEWKIFEKFVSKTTLPKGLLPHQMGNWFFETHKTADRVDDRDAWVEVYSGKRRHMGAKGKERLAEWIRTTFSFDVTATGAGSNTGESKGGKASKEASQ